MTQSRHLQNCEEVPSQSQCPVHSLLEACGSQCLPHQPEFECIRTPAALNGLVTSVIADIVELVLLEQVRSLGRVTLLQEALSETQQRLRLLIGIVKPFYLHKPKQFLLSVPTI